MAKHIHFIPYASDPLQWLAQDLLEQQAARLPRLEETTILLPDVQMAPRLRRALLDNAEQHGHRALLGPQILSMEQWLNRFAQYLPPPVSSQRRELILLSALRHYPHLFGHGSEWALTDSLLELFDELARHRVALPEDAASFMARLAQGYRLPDDQAHHPALQREAALVHTLWQAWHSELSERKLLDRPTHSLLCQRASLVQPPNGPLYILAPVSLSQSERSWLLELAGFPQVTILFQGQLQQGTKPQRSTHPERALHTLASEARLSIPAATDSPLGELWDTLYLPDAEHAPSLAERARSFAARHTANPLTERLRLFSANGHEQEAQAIALQVRRWILAGHQQIGIVTENRKLARRVRALLERAGILLDDAGGWALSTTSAAAALERWLQCVEEDFPHVALLDLLKSPFIVPEAQREAHLNQVYRLQHDVIEAEGVGSGLQRYRQHLAQRAARLPEALARERLEVDRLLQHLEHAATALTTLPTGGTQAALTTLDAVLHSLDTLGLSAQLADDAAGQRLLDELQQMRAALHAEPLEMDWLSFRAWLGRSLERYHFQPPSSGSGVTLLGLGQSAFAHFDALIIAALEHEFIPGAVTGTPFFNDAVRTELGLPSGEEHLAERFYHFRRLLEAAPRILLSYRRVEGDETIAPSPWLESLRAFLQLAWQQDGEASELHILLQDPATQIHASTPLPECSKMPAPQLPTLLLPTRYSASAYQQLLDCPYQFFAARGLSLSAAEPIREALAKSDYGQRIHLCLQAFHQGVEGLPGPFEHSLDAHTQAQAVAMLEAISRAVFAADLEDNFFHRGWLQRWLRLIPGYVAWQIGRAEHWRVKETEATFSQPLGHIELHGRLDRLDSDGERLGVIDYKTGTPPKKEQVLEGEAIQLPFYALLCSGQPIPVGEVAYLHLDDKGVKQSCSLEGDELYALAEAVATRLETLDQQLRDGQALPAWGDDEECRYCKMDGLCRREFWQAEEPLADPQ